MIELRLLPALVVLILAAIFHSSSAFAQTNITIGVVAMSPRTLPLLLAQEQGLFAKHGLDARSILIKGTPNLLGSLDRKPWPSVDGCAMFAG